MQMTLVRGNANGRVRWIAVEASPSTDHFACICKSTRAILFVCPYACISWISPLNHVEDIPGPCGIS